VTRVKGEGESIPYYLIVASRKLLSIKMRTKNKLRVPIDTLKLKDLQEFKNDNGAQVLEKCLNFVLEVGLGRVRRVCIYLLLI